MMTFSILRAVFRAVLYQSVPGTASSRLRICQRAVRASCDSTLKERLTVFFMTGFTSYVLGVSGLDILVPDSDLFGTDSTKT